MQSTHSSSASLRTFESPTVSYRHFHCSCCNHSRVYSANFRRHPCVVFTGSFKKKEPNGIDDQLKYNYLCGATWKSNQAAVDAAEARVMILADFSCAVTASVDGGTIGTKLLTNISVLMPMRVACKPVSNEPALRLLVINSVLLLLSICQLELPC